MTEQEWERERREAESALRALREALADREITLPSLGMDRMPGYHLIELGRCNAETARRLAAALRGAPVAPHPATESLRAQLADLNERVRVHLRGR
jgi:multidrug efflux pump subunit AcrA (membrane-fusion protein)